jgi:hypothetical protein
VPLRLTGAELAGYAAGCSGLDSDDPYITSYERQQRETNLVVGQNSPSAAAAARGTSSET